jgi:hypothetical protein
LRRGKRALAWRGILKEEKDEREGGGIIVCVYFLID